MSIKFHYSNKPDMCDPLNKFIAFGVTLTAFGRKYRKQWSFIKHCTYGEG